MNNDTHCLSKKMNVGEKIIFSGILGIGIDKDVYPTKGKLAKKMS